MSCWRARKTRSSPRLRRQLPQQCGEDREHQQQEAAREEEVREAHRAGKKRVRLEKRQAKEKIVVQQLLVPGLPGARQAPSERFLGDSAARRKQLIAGEESNELLHFFRRW